MAGPLSGFKIIEMAGIGPAPFCAMMFADMGADVVRIDAKPGVRARSGIFKHPRYDLLNRSRRSLALDLKQPGACELMLDLVAKSDAIIEGFRPGVMERLGLGPDICLKRQPRLVYGRMTGWGQDGPLASAAGHDLNYIALTGALHAIGTARAPVPPLNLVGDYGGGGMLLAYGVVCALLEASRSGKGQVVDAAMTEGSAMLATMFFGLHAGGAWTNQRVDNFLDGGAHFYNVYECADGKFVSVGAIEPQFYALLRKHAGLDGPEYDAQHDRGGWPRLREQLAAIFRSRTRAQWCEIMEGTDICFAPVLDWVEAPQHPHNQARQAFVEVDGVTQPAPAPRFSRTPGKVHGPPCTPGQHNEAILSDWGIPAANVAKLKQAGVL